MNRPMTEALERRALLAIDTAVFQTYVDADTNLMVQSAAGASDGNGTSVFVYSDRNASTSLGNEVYVRRFDAANAPLADATVVNTTTADAQMNPDVAMNDSGQFVVVWQSRNQDGAGWGIYAQTFTSAGVAQGTETLVNQTTAGNQVTPRVAIDSTGKFVVTWVNADTGNGEIYARRFDSTSTPLGNEFKVSGATTDGYSAPDVAAMPNGTFAIAWTRTLRSGDNSADVQMQVYDATGTAVGSTIAVNTNTAGDQAEPSLAVAGANFLVAWSDSSTGTASIFFRAYSAAATAVTDPTQASQDSDGDRSRPKIAGDVNGNFEVGWTRQQDGAFYSTNDFRSYDNTFNPTSNETSIGDGSSERTLFDLVQTGQGTFRDVSTINEVIGYGIPVSTSLENVIALDGTSGNDNVVAYALNSTTVRASVNGQQRDYVQSAYVAVVSDLGDGSDNFVGGDLTLAARVTGGAGNDTIVGGSAGDVLSGGDGDDSITGNAGNDTIEGDAGLDTIHGNDGDDSIGGGDDADLIYADDGNDYAIGGSGDDTIYGGAGGDILTAGAGKNRVYGGDGDDRLNGGGGRDYLYGEGGNDRVYGNAGDDSIDGGGGTDKLYGGDGNDFIVGGSSNDRLFGQAGDDTLGGGKGNDYLDGDVGIDTVLGKEPGDTLIAIEHS